MSYINQKIKEAHIAGPDRKESAKETQDRLCFWNAQENLKMKCYKDVKIEEGGSLQTRNI